MLLPAALPLLRARRVVVPPHPGLFSALGLLSTDLVFYESRSSYVVLAPEAAPSVARVFDEMEQRLRGSIPAGTDVTVRRSFDGRLMGQSWETPFVELPDGPIDVEMIETMVARFHDQYERRYGNRFSFIPVQGVTYRVQLVVPSAKVEYTPLAAGDGASVVPDRTRELRYFDETVREIGEFQRDRLSVGARLEGPAIIREDLSTTFVCPGQTAEIGRFGEIVIEEASR
jgi:N-methylhydantoinase A